MIFPSPVAVLVESGHGLPSILIRKRRTAQPKHRMAHTREGGDDGRHSPCLKDRVILTAPERTAPLTVEPCDARRVPLRRIALGKRRASVAVKPVRVRRNVGGCRS